MTTGYQFIRKCSLVVADPSGQGLDLSQLRIRFMVKQFNIQTPNNLYARVYNLAPDTSRRIQNEFTQVVLQAGYENGNFGTIFSGEIKYYRRGREPNATENYLDLFANDSDRAYNYAVVNQTIPPGATPGDLISAALDSVKSFGITKGYQPNIEANRLPRSRTMFGMTRDELRDICRTNNMAFSIVNGQLQLVPLNSYIPGPATVLTSLTGLVGVPEQTPEGICVKSLLNPNLKLGSLVQLDNKSIAQNITLGGSAFTGFFSPPFNQNTGSGYLASAAATDGLYRVIIVNHFGDTRGNEWYSDLVCLGLGDAVPPSVVQQGLGV